MLNNIIKHIINIFSFAGQGIIWLLNASYSLVMFLAMAICGAIGFCVFIMFLGFMLIAVMSALAL